MAHSHDWGVDGVIGYLTKAEEDETGLYVESAFHSTPDAQAVRVKAQERLAAGKQVGLSIGYSIAESKWIDAKDYEKELPIHVKAEHLADAQTKASKFHRIRLLQKVDNFEFSIVTAPMNRKAGATAVKSADGEYKAIHQFLSGKGAAASALTLSERSDLAASACEEFAQLSAVLFPALQELGEDCRSKHEARTKEGRMFSQANINSMQSVCDSIDPLTEGLATVKGELLRIIERATPKENAKPEFVDELMANFFQMQFKELEATFRS